MNTKNTIDLVARLRERASWLAFSIGYDEEYPNTDAELMREAADTIINLLKENHKEG